MKKFKYCFLMSLSVLISGCTTFKETETSLKTEQTNVEKYVEQIKNPSALNNSSKIRISNEQYVGAVKKSSMNGDFLPSRFEAENGVTIMDSSPKTLLELTQLITKQTGLIVFVSPEITKNSSSSPQSNSSSSSSSLNSEASYAKPEDINNLVSGLGILKNTDGDFIKVSTNTPDKMIAQYRGPLSGYLTMIANHFGVSWSYVNGQIMFFKNSVKTYTIDMMDTNQPSIGQGAEKATPLKTTLWEDLKKRFELIVGEEGKVDVSPSWGDLTVKAPPHILNQVEQQVVSYNRAMAKQVVAEAEIYTLTINNTASVNFDVIGNFIGSTSNGFTFGNNTVIDSNFSGSSGVSWSIIKPGSNWAGTEAVFRPLEERGIRVSKKSAVLIGPSNIPIQWKKPETVEYVRKVAVTKDQENGTSTEIEQAEVTFGYEIVLTPKIMSNEKAISLSTTLNVSELLGTKNGFNEFTQNGTTVQQKRIGSIGTGVNVNIPNNTMLVVAGYIEENSSKSGKDSGFSLLLGGSKSATNAKTMIVLVLKPKIIDVNEMIKEVER